MHSARTGQRGAALVVGLLLLSILTLLAIAGMNTASTELVMAGNEQFRETAFQAAETGIEREVVGLFKQNPDADAVTTTTNLTANSKVTTVVTPRGFGPVKGYSPKYVAFHFDVQSTGESSRNATSTHTQGAYYIRKYGGDEQSPLEGPNKLLTPGVAPPATPPAAPTN